MAALMARTAGAVLVLLGAGGMGMMFSSRFLTRLRLLEEARRLVYLLKGEILYANSSLDEAFCRAGHRLGGRMGELAVQVAERIGEKQGRGFGEIWREEVKNLQDLPLSKEDLGQLEEFGRQLGYLDRQMQERTMLLYLEQLELSIRSMRERRQEACRLYTGLSLAGGIFFIILMC